MYIFLCWLFTTEFSGNFFFLLLLLICWIKLFEIKIEILLLLSFFFNFFFCFMQNFLLPYGIRVEKSWNYFGFMLMLNRYNNWVEFECSLFVSLLCLNECKYMKIENNFYYYANVKLNVKLNGFHFTQLICHYHN